MPDPKTSAEIFEEFQDIFGDLFGAGAAGRTTRHVRRELRLTLGEACDGGQRELSAARFVACATCQGRGAPEDATRSECDECEGSGRSTAQPAGFLEVTTSCATCQGAGGSWDTTCEACEGARGERSEQTLVVNLPSGLVDGQVLRFQGMGNDLGDGDGPGDLKLIVVLALDLRWTRDGDDLAGRVEIDEELARDGGVLEVPRFDGVCTLEVPAGTRTGDELRVRGFGALKAGAPPVPLPSDEAPYRSVDTSEHRGDLVATLVLEGDSLAGDEPATDAFGDPRLIAAMVLASFLIVAAMIYGTAILR